MVQFGIWIFDERLGLVGKPEHFPELFLAPDKLWDIKETNRGQVWKWPIEFARIGWFSPSVADDFNKTFFYAQKLFKGFRPTNLQNLDIDAKTIQLQTEILSDYFPGPDDEVSARV